MGDYSYLPDVWGEGDQGSAPERIIVSRWSVADGRTLNPREITVTLDADNPRLIANIQKAIAESDPACCIKIVVSRGTQAPPPAQQAESPKPNPHEGLHRAIRPGPRVGDLRQIDR